MLFDSWGEFYDGSSLPARVWPQQQGAELNHHPCCARFVAIRCAWTPNVHLIIFSSPVSPLRA